ncbi:hypothetical protein BBJ28_00016731 [Nothophytophthora sp. Chile5]|nr:hypothetical protein BBJ28_00016731 [Nothophytophthora sp. Chile5]
MAEDENVKVFCRVRPPNERESGVETTALGGSAAFIARSHASASSASFVKKCITVPTSDPMQQTVFLHSKHGAAKTFTFDRVFGEESSQTDVFEVVGAPITQACLEGYNGTIFAYGQTGSGKTFTMQGPDDVIDTESHSLTNEELGLRGLVPRVFDYLFNNVVAKDSGTNVQHTFACSFLEIYNERVYDLLDGGSTKDAAGLQLRENGRKGVHVEGLIESVVTNAKKAAELMTIGAQNRRVGQTSMNRESSRSHSVFILQLQTKEVSAEGTKIRTSRFNLVDLAGSERQRSTEAAGDRLKEAGSINKSLSALGNVILGLSEQSAGKHRHVHYRDSKLTFLLKDSLGGNSKTFMIATISPAEDSAFETLSTLKFAQRAKMIQNNAVINEDSTGNALFMQEEIQRLRRQLQQARQEIARNLPDSNFLLQGATPSKAAADTGEPSAQQLALPFDPVVGGRFRELEEAFATTVEKNDRLQRACEYLQIRDSNFQELISELKRNITRVKLMLRMRRREPNAPLMEDSDMVEYEPSADAIEWRIKYDEMEERFVQSQDAVQRNGMAGSEMDRTEQVDGEVENLNFMLLALTKQLAFVIREKHELQDRLLQTASGEDGSVAGPSSQEVATADFSARLEESLKLQANEYEAKMASLAAISAIVEEKGGEISFELLEIKQREASWTIQRNDMDRQLAESTSALLRLEETQALTQGLLVQEKHRTADLLVQLERAREGIRLEFEATLADANTLNRELETSHQSLRRHFATATEELKLRELRGREAEEAMAQLRVTASHLEEANQTSMAELGAAQSLLKAAEAQTTRMAAEITDRDGAIDKLKHLKVALDEEKSALVQQLEAASKSIVQLQEDAVSNANTHAMSIEMLNRHAEEETHKLSEDFEEQMRGKNEQLQHLHDELDHHKSKAEETARLHQQLVEEQQTALVALQREFENHKQQANHALEAAQQKLSDARSAITKLSDEKRQVELECAFALQEADRLQSDLSKHQQEKDAMANEMTTLSERTEQLSTSVSELQEHKSALSLQCEDLRAELGRCEGIIRIFTDEAQELQQRVTSQTEEVAKLRNDLALAQEAAHQAVSTHARTVDELEKAHDAKLTAVQQLADESVEALRKEATSAEILVQEKQTVVDKLLGHNCKLEANNAQQLEEIVREVGASAAVTKRAATLEQDIARQAEELADKSASLKALQGEMAEATLAHERNSEELKVSMAKQEECLQDLNDTAADREERIRALETTIADSIATQDQLKETIAELRSSVHDLEGTVRDEQSTAAMQQSVLEQKLVAVSDKDGVIHTLQEQMRKNEAVWEQKAREYTAELEATHGRVQAFEQFIAEKESVFAKAEETFLTDTHSLQQKLDESEDTATRQVELSKQLMQEVEQLGLVVKEKDAQLKVADESTVKLEARLQRSTELAGGVIAEHSNRKIEELQSQVAELDAKHNSLLEENLRLKHLDQETSELKAREEELSRRRSEVEAAAAKLESDRKALDEQKAAVLEAESELKKIKVKGVSEDEPGQMKRQFLREKVKLQREAQALSKKLDALSKENEKLVGHHNSRQKIQHHAKVKEENNRLLEQVRHLTDDKFKLSRSLEKLKAVLKEKENIGVNSRSNTPTSVASASSSNTPTTSLLDVAKAMNGEAAGSSGKLSLLDVAKKDAAAPAVDVRRKPATLMDVAKQGVQPSEGHHATRSEKPTLQQLAQEIDKEDRSKVQKALDTTAKEVKTERQELREEALKQAAAEVQQEEQQAAQALRAKVTTVKASKLEATKLETTNQSIVKTEEDADGYSSFEEDEEPSPNEGRRTKEHAEPVEDEASDEDGNLEPPPRTTPSDSKESKEFLRAVYRADKYRIRDMLDEDVDVNIADQVHPPPLIYRSSATHFSCAWVALLGRSMAGAACTGRLRRTTATS